MCALLLGSVSIRYWNHSLDSSPSDVSDLVPAEQYHPTLPPNIRDSAWNTCLLSLKVLPEWDCSDRTPTELTADGSSCRGPCGVWSYLQHGWELVSPKSRSPSLSSVAHLATNVGWIVQAHKIDFHPSNFCFELFLYDHCPWLPHHLKSISGSCGRRSRSILNLSQKPSRNTP